MRKQAEQSLTRFLARRHADVQLSGELYKTALVIRESTPHPLTGETVTLPVALLNWHDDRWRLYFRGTRGRWLRMPESPAISRPEPLARQRRRRSARCVLAPVILQPPQRGFQGVFIRAEIQPYRFGVAEVGAVVGHDTGGGEVTQRFARGPGRFRSRPERWPAAADSAGRAGC